MKTMRFATVVAQAGKPDVHLSLVDPARDAPLQKALKAHRVMTIHQSRGSTDYGTIGYEKTPTSQILIFPRSLRKFASARIVGVKYDLLARPPEPKREAMKSPKPRKSKADPKPKRPQRSGKVTAFIPPRADRADPEEESLTDLQAGIRRALRLMDEGKPVAAYNYLKLLAS